MSPFQGRYRLSTNLSFFWILNTLPFRGAIASLPTLIFQSKYHIDCDIATWGDARTFGGGLRRSTVAHFARKVRGTNIAAAKHDLKIQQSHAPERWSCSLRVRGPHFASKVSYNAGAPSSAANNSSIRVIRCYAVQGPNLRPILRRKKRVIRPFKVRIGNLSTDRLYYLILNTCFPARCVSGKLF